MYSRFKKLRRIGFGNPPQDVMNDTVSTGACHALSLRSYLIIIHPLCWIKLLLLGVNYLSTDFSQKFST